MALEEKIVSDSNGFTTNADSRQIVGTIKPVGNSPYRFYAVTNEGENPVSQITMVLPVGGKLSGLYRFPRVGEKVLVDSIGNNASKQYFLLGYVPSEGGAGSVPFAPLEGTPQTTKPGEQKKLLADQQGMVLRYQQTGKTDSKAVEEYSEIGFYHQATPWKLTDDTKADYKDKNEELLQDKDGDPILIDGKKVVNTYPKIDRINIQSTGDIHSRAANHHRIMATRFELLAGCEEINHKTNRRIDPGTGQDKTGKNRETLPLGDVPGDDSKLHPGDVHIRAGKRVVIKAADEIRLKVGRTTLIINDDGFKVVTRKIDSNWETSFDTSLNLDPRDGITMFGQSVNITSGHKMTVGDSLGGALSIVTGVTSLSGRELNLESADAVQYLMLVLLNTLDYSMNTSAVSLAQGEEDPAANKHYKYADLTRQFVKKLKPLFLQFCTDWKLGSERTKENEAAQRAAAPQQEGGDAAVPAPPPVEGVAPE